MALVPDYCGKVFAPFLENERLKTPRELLCKQFIRIQYHNLEIFSEHVGSLLSRLLNEGIVDLRPLFFSLIHDLYGKF